MKVVLSSIAIATVIAFFVLQVIHEAVSERVLKRHYAVGRFAPHMGADGFILIEWKSPQITSQFLKDWREGPMFVNNVQMVLLLVFLSCTFTAKYWAQILAFFAE